MTVSSLAWLRPSRYRVRLSRGSANGPTPISGAGGATSDASFIAGTYDLSETTVAGYSPSNWSCTGGTQNGAQITVGLSESATCTITNDDISPRLTVIKTVVNDNGGTAAPDDFNLTVDGGAVLSGVPNDFDAGAHTVAETLLAGYSAGDFGGDCAADGSITLALDRDATCTITNDDVAPTGNEPRTIGYWKAWNSCSGGNQVETAIRNGGPTPGDRIASGNALLDDVLQPPGITIGEELSLSADADVFDCDQDTQDAVNILDKRDLSGKKKASDAAYGLAAQLLAAIANDIADAGVCQAAGQAITLAQVLLKDIDFDGTGDYSKGRVDEIDGHTKADANALAETLDSYNNGVLCSP